jgi:hypothetical protein
MNTLPRQQQAVLGTATAPHSARLNGLVRPRLNAAVHAGESWQPTQPVLQAVSHSVAQGRQLRLF